LECDFCGSDGDAARDELRPRDSESGAVRDAFVLRSQVAQSEPYRAHPMGRIDNLRCQRHLALSMLRAGMQVYFGRKLSILNWLPPREPFILIPNGLFVREPPIPHSYPCALPDEGGPKRTMPNACEK
jgi:hypothetical protein